VDAAAERGERASDKAGPASCAASTVSSGEERTSSWDEQTASCSGTEATADDLGYSSGNSGSSDDAVAASLDAAAAAVEELAVHWTNELRQIVSSQVPSEFRASQVAAAKPLVEWMCVKFFKALGRLRQVQWVTVSQVGSWSQGTAMELSDLDLLIHLSFEDSPSPGWEAEELAALEAFIVGGGHTACDRFEVVHSVLRARVPVLRLALDHSLYVDVVLSVQPRWSPVKRSPSICPNLRRDNVVRSLLARAPEAASLVVLIKLWAKAKGHSLAFSGGINSVTWSLLVIAFLQQNQLLPGYQWMHHWTSPDHCVSLHGLLLGFFGFLVEMQFGSRHFSVVLGMMLEQRDPNAVIDIEDPAQQSLNTAHAVTHPCWMRVLQDAEREFVALQGSDVSAFEASLRSGMRSPMTHVPGHAGVMLVQMVLPPGYWAGWPPVGTVP